MYDKKKLKIKVKNKHNRHVGMDRLNMLTSLSSMKKVDMHRKSHRERAQVIVAGYFNVWERKQFLRKLQRFSGDVYIPLGVLRFLDVTPTKGSARLYMGIVTDGSADDFVCKVEYFAKAFPLAKVTYNHNLSDSPVNAYLTIGGRDVVIRAIPTASALNMAIFYYSVPPWFRSYLTKYAHLHHKLLKPYGLYDNGRLVRFQHHTEIPVLFGLNPDLLHQYYAAPHASARKAVLRMPHVCGAVRNQRRLTIKLKKSQKEAKERKAFYENTKAEHPDWWSDKSTKDDNPGDARNKARALEADRKTARAIRHIKRSCKLRIDGKRVPKSRKQDGIHFLTD